VQILLAIYKAGMYNGTMRINTSKIKATLRLIFARVALLVITPFLLVLLLAAAMSWTLLYFTITVLFLIPSLLMKLRRPLKM
jgi:hypothetical protein